MDKYILPDGTEIFSQEIQSRADREGITFSELVTRLGARKAIEENISQTETPLTNFQSVKNSFTNAIQDFKGLVQYGGRLLEEKDEFGYSIEPIKDKEGNDITSGAPEAFDIMVSSIASAIFGAENVDKFVEEQEQKMRTFGVIPDSDFQVLSDEELEKRKNFNIRLGTDETISSIKVFQDLQKERGETKQIVKSVKQKDAGGAFAGVVNAVVNGLSSSVIAKGTGGVKPLSDYSAENYIFYNTEKAKNLNKSLESIIVSGEADTLIPVGIAAVQAGLEYVGATQILRAAFGKQVVKEVGRKIMRKALYNKAARKTLSIMGAGGTEFTTEVLQHVSSEVNNELGRVAGTDEEAKIKDTILEAVTSQEALEAGVQGFFGGSGITAGSYSAQAVAEARKITTPGEIEDDIDEFFKLKNKLKKEKDEVVKEGIQEKINAKELDISDKVKKGNDAHDNIPDEELLEIEDRDEAANLAAYKITELNKKLISGEISQENYETAISGFESVYKKSKERIKEIVYSNAVKAAEKVEEETGLDLIEVKNNAEAKEEYAKAEYGGYDSKKKKVKNGEFDKDGNKVSFSNLNSKQKAEINKKVLSSSGVFYGKGKIILNKQQALRANGTVTVATHEVLHPILNALVGDINEQERVVKQFKKAATWNQRRWVAEQIRKKGLSKQEANEEWIPIFAEGIANKDINYDLNVFERMRGTISSIFASKGLDKVGFENGDQVYLFIKKYAESASKGEFDPEVREAISLREGEKGIKIADVDGLDGTPQASTNLSQEIDSLVPEGSTKSDFQSDAIGDAYTRLVESNLIDGLIGEGIVGNNVFGKPKSQYIQEVKENVGLRLMTFDPEKNSLSGWLLAKKKVKKGEGKVYNRSILNFAKADVLNKFQKTQTSPIINKEGKEIDIVSEEKTPEEQLIQKEEEAIQETKTLEEVKKDSLRRQIGVETGDATYNTVLNSVKNVFKEKGKSLPKVGTYEFKGALQKQFESKIFKQVQKLFGKGKNYISFLEKNYEKIFESLTVRTLTALERKQKEKVFISIEKKNLTPNETRAALNLNIIESKSDTQSSDLYVKRKITKKQFMDFFNPTSDQVKTNRKISLAKAIASELGLDATMEALTDQNIIDQRIAEQGITKSEFELEVGLIARQINRDPKAQFSTNANVKLNDKETKILDNNKFGILSAVIRYSNKEKEVFVIDQKALDKTSLKDEEKEVVNSIFDQIKGYLNTLLPETERQTADKIYFLKSVANLDHLDGLTLPDPNNPKKQIPVVTKTTAGNKKLNSKLFVLQSKGEGKQLAAPFIKEVIEQAKNLMNTMPSPVRSKLQEILGGSRYAQFAGQSYRMLNSSKKDYDNNLKLEEEERVINAYLSFLGEFDESSIQELIEKSSGDPERQAYLRAMEKALKLANETYEYEEGKSVSYLQPITGADAKKGTIIDQYKKNKNKSNFLRDNAENIKKVNEANQAMFEALVLMLKNGYVKGEIDDRYLLGVLSGQSSASAGFRAFSRIQGFSLITQKINANGEVAKNRKGQVIPEEIETGEHININGQTMEEVYAFVVGDKSAIKLNQISSKHNQILISKRQAKKLSKYKINKKSIGPVSSLGLKRLDALRDNEVEIVDTDIQTAILQIIYGAGAVLETNTTTDLSKEDGKRVGQKSTNIKINQKVETKNQINLNKVFNEILEQTTENKNKKIKAEKKYTATEARIEGRNKGKYKFFVPASADNFMGLMYSFLTKGKLGDKQKDFFETFLNAPYKRGVAAMDIARQKIANDFSKIKKKNFGFVAQQMLDVRLMKEVPGTRFTYDNAIRVYIWNKAGFTSEDLEIDQSQINKLVEAVESDPKLKNFANDLNAMLGNKYPEPSQYWDTESISYDLNTLVDNNRSEYLKEFIENSEQVFTEENLNKVQAIYGLKFRESLEGFLKTMKSGKLRDPSKSEQTNNWLDWLNNSTGAIMFVNLKSSILQLVSAVNYLNWNDNNPINAALAYANAPQFWSDFLMILNSDKLKQRRAGTKINITEAEISNAVRGKTGATTFKSVLQVILRKGFAFTRIADSLAIAIGGAPMYRNRVNTYLKQGLSKEQAEKTAFEDFSAITEETQQSSDPSEISAQQRSDLGRIILAFANTPLQYARLTKKAYLDLVNRRGDWKTNVSKIFYYTAVQNLIFSTLQTGLFATLGLGDDDEEEGESEEKRKKREKTKTTQIKRVFNNSLDTILKGMGVRGAAVAALKNGAIELYKQQTEKTAFNRDFYDVLVQLTQVSPPLGSKISKLNSAFKQFNIYEKDVIEAKGFSYDSPIYEVGGKFVSGFTNAPLDRIAKKTRNVNDALTNDFELWQKIFLFLGWTTWELGLENQEHELIKRDAKDARRKEGYRKAARTRRLNAFKKKGKRGSAPTGEQKISGEQEISGEQKIGD
jgi:hypothetical protein